MKLLKTRDEGRLAELKRIYEKESKEKEEEEARIKKIFSERRKNMEKETQKEKYTKLIQYNFEKWFEIVGQFIKTKKKPKANQ